jgi:hypothetical protein
MKSTILKRILELQKEDFYSKSIFINDKVDPKRKKDQDEYFALTNKCKETINSLKKGEKVLLINDNKIIEVEVKMALRRRTKSTWVGDGYEDMEFTSIKFQDDKYVYSNTQYGESFLVERI